MKTPFTLVCLASALAACGGDPLDPGAGDDPGTGSSTLLIDADIHAEHQVDNASSATDFDTEMEVTIEKNGQAVTTGTVTVTSAGGTVELAYDTDGRWRATQGGYHEVYELSVTSGDDFVEGVRVDGPALHYFTTPTAGATVDSTVPLEVVWAAGEAADTATIETKESDRITIADTRAYTLAAGSLKSKETETEEEELRLDRSARISLGGAVGGSELRVQISNRIDLVVEPTGAL